MPNSDAAAAHDAEAEAAVVLDRAIDALVAGDDWAALIPADHPEADELQGLMEVAATLLAASPVQPGEDVAAVQQRLAERLRS